MLFYITTFNIVRFLSEDAPKLKEYEHDIQVINVVDTWKCHECFDLFFYTMCIRIRKQSNSYGNH